MIKKAICFLITYLLFSPPRKQNVALLKFIVYRKISNRGNIVLFLTNQIVDILYLGGKCDLLYVSTFRYLDLICSSNINNIFHFSHILMSLYSPLTELTSIYLSEIHHQKTNDCRWNRRCTAPFWGSQFIWLPVFRSKFSINLLNIEAKFGPDLSSLVISWQSMKKNGNYCSYCTE